jgi:hypothetical protein
MNLSVREKDLQATHTTVGSSRVRADVAKDEVVDAVRSVLDRRRPRPGRDGSRVELGNGVTGDLSARWPPSDGGCSGCAGRADVADLEGVRDRVAVHLLVEFEGDLERSLVVRTWDGEQTVVVSGDEFGERRVGRVPRERAEQKLESAFISMRPIEQPGLTRDPREQRA